MVKVLHQYENRKVNARIWWWLLVTLAVLVGSLVGVYGAYRLVMRVRVDVRADKIRQAGYPATWKEMDAWYAIPQGAKNAADVMMRAFEHHVKWEDEKREKLPIEGEVDLPELTEPLDKDTKTLIAGYLADNAEAIKLIRAAVKIKHSRYPVDFTKGIMARTPHLVPVRVSTRLLMLEAIMASEANDADAAIDSIESMMGVGRTLKKEPSIISQLVAMSCRKLALQACEQVANTEQCCPMDNWSGWNRLFPIQQVCAISHWDLLESVVWQFH